MKYLIAAVILSLPAFAQPEGQLSLAGTVVNSKTGAPVAHAMVTATRFGPLEEDASPADARDADQLLNREAFTDPGGLFRITGLPSGRYSLTVQKPEFTWDQSADTLQNNTLTLSASVENLVERLSPLGVITGSVTDQDGLPLPGVNVILLSAQIRDGLRQVNSDRTVTTDDRGTYRCWNLGPGKYYVKAAGVGGGTVEYVGDNAPWLGDESFAPTYFGGSHTLDSAAPVEIGPGSEARADFVLNVGAAFRITGSIASFVPRHSIKFELLSGAEDVSTTKVTINSDTGRFIVGAVVPGSYVLRATQDQSTAEAPVTVGSSDLVGVAMALTPPADIAAVTQFTNSLPDNSPLGRMAAGNCNAVLRPVENPGTHPPLYSRPVPKPGTGSVVSGVTPGKYAISIQCLGAYPQSATWGTQDLGANPILTVAPGISPAPIQITAAYGGGSIRGALPAEAGAEANRVTVLLTPRFSSAAGPLLSQAFAVADAPGKLQFQFANLAPGSYTAWAFANPEIEFRNPEFLRTLTGGELVEIDGDGEKEMTISGVIH